MVCFVPVLHALIPAPPPGTPGAGGPTAAPRAQRPWGDGQASGAAQGHGPRHQEKGGRGLEKQRLQPVRQ